MVLRHIQELARFHVPSMDLYILFRIYKWRRELNFAAMKALLPSLTRSWLQHNSLPLLAELELELEQVQLRSMLWRLKMLSSKLVEIVPKVSSKVLELLRRRPKIAFEIKFFKTWKISFEILPVSACSDPTKQQRRRQPGTGRNKPCRGS